MTSNPQPATRIARSWGQTLGIGGVGAGFCALAVYLGNFEYTGWAIVCGIVGVCFVFGAWKVAGSANCPSCGRRLTSLSLMSQSSYRRCPYCENYNQDGGGWLRSLEENCIAGEPAFSIYLPKEFRLPDLCCLCGQPATRTEKLSLKLRVSSGPVAVTQQEVVVSLNAPHCDNHQGGAKLTRETREKPGTFTEPGPVATVLKVQSYAFYQEFRRLNESG
jgi:hypothetical protein